MREGAAVNGSPEIPLVTVITVVRNDKALLARTVKSVLDQTYQNIEYIIIDGASTDGTVDLIKKHEDRIAYWVSEPDTGIYDAMNKGIRLAKGEWINFMNAGDTFYAPDSVARVFSRDVHDADLLYGDCVLEFENGFSAVLRSRRVDAVWKGMIFRHQALFTRSSICREHPFDTTYQVGADYAFIYDCYRRGCRFRGIPDIIASASLGGMSDTNIVLGIRENLRAVLTHDDSWKVRLYYHWTILLLRMRIASKRVLPAWITNAVRAVKYRIC
jgi:glycosyltransferase involved in cell wall biosynthesis